MNVIDFFMNTYEEDIDQSAILDDEPVDDVNQQIQ